MDPRLLDYYNRELSFIREMGLEFAHQHPKIAGRLGMKGLEVADPYVERLLEGFALLTSRIQLKMDAEFPRFSQRLLELIYPQLLSPTPAMGIVKLQPADMDGGITESFRVPRHTIVRAPISPGQVTACQFRTAHEVELLPLALTKAWIEGPSSHVRMPSDKRKAGSSLHLVLESHLGMELGAMAFDTLPIYIAGPLDRALQLLELVCARVMGVSVQWEHVGQTQQAWLPPGSVTGMGFSEDEALIPYNEQSFSGYRLLHEYFACPDRFRFFKISHLRKALDGVAATSMEIVLHFDRECPEYEKVVTQDSFQLYCTPVINLFPKRGDRVVVSLAHHEHHLLGDRTRPMDYEVYSVQAIQGFSADNSHAQSFQPIYATCATGEANQADAYFSIRREPRTLSDRARRHGPRTGYVGSEVHAQLVDRKHAPHASTLVRIAPDLMCTNRDLPLLITSAAERNFQLTVSAPVKRVELISTLTRPSAAIAERKVTWKLISHLQLNFHSLTDTSPQAGASIMRELLGLYAGITQGDTSQHVDAITSMKVEPVHARLRQPGPIVYGRGVEVQLEIDLDKFGGGSPWLFGAILERFFARHAGINSATQLKMSTLQSGAFAQWPLRMGTRSQV